MSETTHLAIAGTLTYPELATAGLLAGGVLVALYGLAALFATGGFLAASTMGVLGVLPVVIGGTTLARWVLN